MTSGARERTRAGVVVVLYRRSRRGGACRCVLLKFGASDLVNTPDNFGNTPLVRAAARPSREVIIAAQHFACGKYSNKEVAAALISRGADVNFGASGVAAGACDGGLMAAQAQRARVA